MKPPGGIIFESDDWIVFSRSRPAVPGYLFIVLKRHCEDVGELTPEEAASFGAVMQKTCVALSALFNPPRIYVCSFGEDVRHIHFHVIPRTESMPVGALPVFIYLRLYPILQRLGLKRAYTDAEIAGIAHKLREWM